MDEDEARGPRLSKRFSDKDGGGEVDYKTKAGTAWSHSFLNQKPWHPLSYPNQRRKWIAEQTHAQRDRRAIEVAREYAQEQEFFRQTALVSKKEKEKMEMMKAVSFMYVRPPGYNAESAKAAEIAEDVKKQEPNNTFQDPSSNVDSAAMPLNSMLSGEEKKKPRPKDIYGRALPTEEQFEVLKNAPRLETGVAARAKPFGVEIRNVKCLRCGNFGHQSGDRECPLKDTIMPNEESRLKRDDPLTTILDHTDPTEPLKWELKQKPGMSPPRGGFKPDDPNQQIVAEDIFDEYGGFLSGQNIPELLTNFSSKKPKKKKSTSKGKHKRRSSPHITELTDHEESNSSDDDDDRGRRSKTKKDKKKKRLYPESSSPDKKKKRKYNESSSPDKKKKRKYSESSSADKKKKQEYSEPSSPEKKRKRKYSESSSPDNSKVDRQHRSRHRRHYSSSSDSSGSDRKHKSKHWYHHSRSHHWHRPDSLSK